MAALIGILAAGLAGAPARAADPTRPSGKAGPLAQSMLAAATPIGVTTVGLRLFNADGDTANKCLDVHNGGVGTAVQMWGCNGQPNQDWFPRQSSDGRPIYKWLSYASGAFEKCMQDMGNGSQGAQVHMQPCANNPATQWWIPTLHSGLWNWWCNYGTGLCLDVRAHGTSNIVQTWPRLDQGNQRWKYA